LSRHESLSLVALEAWTCGTPVIADTRSQVLTGHLGRCQGGAAVADSDSFAAALDDLLQRPEHWRTLCESGRDYVGRQYCQRAPFLQVIVDTIRGLAKPLGERMRRRGLQRASERDRFVWRERFGHLIEKVLDTPAQPYRIRVEVRPRSVERKVT